MKVTCGDF